jgi:hypothetical protein
MRAFLVACFLLAGSEWVTAANADAYAVFSEHGNVDQKGLACWVCKRTDAGTAACLGTGELPFSSWPTREQAAGSACVYLRTGKCLEVKNYQCQPTAPAAMQPASAPVIR